jgi:hypothetical protein
MCAAKLSSPLCIEQGATFKQVFIWKTGSPANPVDLTGYKARMQARKTPPDSTVFVDLTTENGGITLGADGSIRLYISADDTTEYKWRDGVFDLELIDTLGGITRLIQGAITVSEEVTR